MIDYITIVRAVYSLSQRQAAATHKAVGQAACRKLISTKYIHLSDLLGELRIAKNNSLEACIHLRKQYEKFGLLIIDEWLLFPISTEDSEVLLSQIDRRHNARPTIIVSQFEPA